MKFYWLRPVEPSRFTGEYRAEHRWYLPGVHCPLCNASWSATADEYPCVDLTALEKQAKFDARLEEDYAEFERMRELVRPLAPPGALLRPGTAFGPLVGSARGSFGQLFIPYGWSLLIRREALEQLQAEGVRGLQGRRAELRFRQKNAPELVEMQLEPQGLLHQDCLPQRPPPCPKCGRDGFRRPEDLLLDAASLPGDRDLFRLANFGTVIVGTERFVDTVRRLQFEEVDFRELPVR
jgi:uncharacterized double-CXXCG motif protein